MSKRTTVTVAKGDGIGPEIMAATLHVLRASGAPLDFEEIEVGEAAYLKGHSAGIASEAWGSLRRTRVFLKAPVTTPQGKGFKSLNVTIRKTLGLYANVRPCAAYAPYVQTSHPKMDLVIIRENEEDLYAGIEHRQTQDVYQCLKLISRPGCERIARYAFEYARAHGRTKVTCLSKDNIMKLTDGLFRKVFEEIGEEYPEIAKEHMIVDIGTARVADRPESFDVVLTSNLYGDIISDVAAEVAGSVGLAPSSNIGEGFAMFEAIHGSAPDIAGKDIANPSGLLLSAVEMLTHVGYPEPATLIRNAWLRTIEDGVHTGDLKSEATKQLVGTKAFAEAVVARFGQEPRELGKNTTRRPGATATTSAAVMKGSTAKGASKPTVVQKKELVGVDVFVDARDVSPNALAEKLLGAQKGSGLSLSLVTNRGTRVWPDGAPETFCVDHWRCRFKAEGGGHPESKLLDSGKTEGADSLKSVSPRAVIALLNSMLEAGVEFVKTEHLYTFDGERGYSLGQGEG